MSSQKSYLSFNHIGIEHGLTDIKANTIVQDKLCFTWVGTDFGLNRHDQKLFIENNKGNQGKTDGSTFKFYLPINKNE